ncbi:hypothetical protein C2E23DRAFT_812940 [Lenzites betulinus]|nr:hypothetical protein C2E23DRAFT_812940 [Lenzites betulinus]
MVGTARPRARLASLSVHSLNIDSSTPGCGRKQKPAGSPRTRTHPNRALVILMAHSGLGSRELASAGGLHRSRLAMRAPHNVCDALRIARCDSAKRVLYRPILSAPQPAESRRAPRRLILRAAARPSPDSEPIQLYAVQSLNTLPVDPSTYPRRPPTTHPIARTHCSPIPPSIPIALVPTPRPGAAGTGGRTLGARVPPRAVRCASFALRSPRGPTWHLWPVYPCRAWSEHVRLAVPGQACDRLAVLPRLGGVQ